MQPLLAKDSSFKGRYSENVPLKNLTWFKVGGIAPLVFRPHSVEDLSLFYKNTTFDSPPLILGVGSNLLIRDGGIDNIVIKLAGKSFSQIIPSTTEDNVVYVYAGALDRTIALQTAAWGIGGFEFLAGIPGTLGGAIAMNAGCYGKEIKDILVYVDIMDQNGSIHRLLPDDLAFSYRHAALPKNAIVIGAAMRGHKEDAAIVQKKISELLNQRELTQPVRSATGGSTFKNPLPHKAWELIDQAGCRGLKVGDAQVSEQHCNFLINTGNATAQELESLGTLVQKKVLEKTGIQLEWEIIRLGKH